jgi:hypothetical protein
MPAVADMLAAAVREGRHAPASAFRTVCDGCGEWVGGIFHADPYSKKRLCLGCSAMQGVKGAPEEIDRLANAASRSSRGGHNRPDGSAGAVPPKGQPADTRPASQAAGSSPADARTGGERQRHGADDMTPQPAAGPASTVARTFFDVLND